MTNKQRREQQSKGGENKALARAMQEKRRSSATTPIPSGTKYRRPKAGSRNREW